MKHKHNIDTLYISILPYIWNLLFIGLKITRHFLSNPLRTPMMVPLKSDYRFGNFKKGLFI